MWVVVYSHPGVKSYSPPTWRNQQLVSLSLTFFSTSAMLLSLRGLLPVFELDPVVGIKKSIEDHRLITMNHVPRVHLCARTFQGQPPSCLATKLRWYCNETKMSDVKVMFMHNYQSMTHHCYSWSIKPAQVGLMSLRAGHVMQCDTTSRSPA